MRRLAVVVLLVLVLAGNCGAEELKIIVALKGHNLNATLEDNPASRILYNLLPVTFKMQNVYQREMAFTLPGKLPVNRLSANSYSVGDIIYMPHRNSLVILYKQNGERFRRQNIGHIVSGAEIFRDIKEAEITFAPAE